MKKSILWGIIALVFIIGGGGIFIHEQNQQQRRNPAPQVASSNHKKSSSSDSSSSSESSAISSQSSSIASSSASSAASSSNADDNQSTGTAGQHGEGKKGDHTVNGKEVDQDTIINVKDKLKGLGFNANAWSPQDIINLYRYCVNKGHSDPDQITKEDVEGYLK